MRPVVAWLMLPFLRNPVRVEVKNAGLSAESVAVHGWQEGVRWKNAGLPADTETISGREEDVAGERETVIVGE